MKKMLATRQNLLDFLATQANVPDEYRIAVGLLLFTPDDKILLLKRGVEARDAQGQFEGVGGSLDDGEDDLVRAIKREVAEEIGGVEVSIDGTLGVKILPGESDPWWVVVDFVGRIQSGTPMNMEPHKSEGIYTFSLEESFTLDLSKYQRATMDTYQAEFGTTPYYQRS